MKFFALQPRYSTCANICIHNKLPFVCTFIGSATIEDDNMATVTVSNLACEQTYTVTAGGIVIGGMDERELIGPQFRQPAIVTAGPCPTTIMTTTESMSKMLRIFVCMYAYMIFMTTIQ